MNLRELFEKLHPVPEGAGFSMLLNQYCALPSKVDRFGEIGLACEAFNLIWQGFQSGHAAGLDDAAKVAENYDDFSTILTVAESIRAMKEPK